MRLFFVFSLFFLCTPIISFGQSIFSNPITGVNPNGSNPYITGQIKDTNISVSGIGRGSGIFGINANNRYDARSWMSAEWDTNAYFEFSLIPNPDKKIDFINFIYSGQISVNGPTHFAFRSSVDGFTSDIGLVSASGTTVSLSNSSFQNITSPITFRIYAWAAVAGTGTFSVNDFEFNGIVSCINPEIPVLPEIQLPCTATSFDINWSESSFASSYIIDVATDSDFINSLPRYQNKAVGDILSETISGVTAGGKYYIRLRSVNSCATSASSNVIKVAPPETVYNGIWSNGNPDETKKVQFSSDFNINSDIKACSCQINPGISVTVNSGVILKLVNELNLLGTGSITFENNASLVQVNDAAVNTGTISYKRISTAMKALDYTDWSSPVSGQILKVLSPNTASDKYYSFWNRVWVNENLSNVMSVGKGYTIRTPKAGVWPPPYPETVVYPYAQPVSFVGTPNNGNYSSPVNPNAGRYSFVGNPYPSALNADDFIPDNSAAIDGTIYIWTHNTPITQVGSSNVYTSDDYATYNAALGGVAATSSNIPDANSNEPTGSIAAGQGFVVISATVTTGNIIFNNSMRSDVADSNSQFFRGTKTNKAIIERHRIWLSLRNNQGAFKQTLIGYATGATNENDAAFDASNYSKNSFIDFYSLISTKKCVIQGRSLPFDKKDEVPLGYKSTIDGTFSISIDKVDGMLANQDVFVEDKVTGILHNLKKGAYSFTTLKGTFDNRFLLRYASNPKLALLNEAIENPMEQLQIFTKENQLYLRSVVENISAVFIYDLKGALIYQRKNIDNNQVIITSLGSNHQILIVKTIFSNASIRTNKIIF